MSWSQTERIINFIMGLATLFFVWALMGSLSVG